jgi:CBS domain-containing protein
LRGQAGPYAENETHAAQTLVRATGGEIMHVGHIVTRTVETCAATDSALTLATRMRNAHVGDLVVVEYRDGVAVPVGLVTDRDLVVTVLAEQQDTERVSAAKIMTRALVVVREDADIGVAIEQMRRAGIRRLPVVDASGKLTGIVALDDIIQYLASVLADVSRVSQVQPVAEHCSRA